MQLNVGIIAASIPTMKPLLRQKSRSSDDERIDRFDDIDRPKTFGSSGRASKRKTLSATVGTKTEVCFEMVSRLNVRDKNTVYNIRADRAGSEDDILDRSERRDKQIQCTTEVHMDVEQGART